MLPVFNMDKLSFGNFKGKTFSHKVFVPGQVIFIKKRTSDTPRVYVMKWFMERNDEFNEEFDIFKENFISNSLFFDY